VINLNIAKNKDLTTFESQLQMEKQIPAKWRRYLVMLFKEQVREIQEPEEIRDIIDSWRWIRKLDPFMMLTLRLLGLSGASTPYFLAVDYLFEKGVEAEHQRKKDIQKLAARFRRACHKLYRSGLLTGVAVKPEEVGPGRHSVTIWVTPFAKDKEIDKIRNFYIDLVEGRFFQNKHQKKETKDLTLHNRKMKVLSILDKYKEHPAWYDYYKCPKKHEKGLETHKKLKSAYKRKKFVFKCKECNRDLTEISFDEFMSLKKKQLYKKWDIKE
jgi:hypothetical protein